MSIGWEEWAKDEKDEYRMRRWVQDEKNEYMMRRMSTRWEGWVQDEKDEYAGLEGWVQDEYRMREWAHDERMSTGWEGWVQDEKNEHWKKKNEKVEYRMSSEWEEGVVSMHILPH